MKKEGAWGRGEAAIGKSTDGSKQEVKTRIETGGKINNVNRGT